MLVEHVDLPGGEGVVAARRVVEAEADGVLALPIRAVGGADGGIELVVVGQAGQAGGVGFGASMTGSAGDEGGRSQRNSERQPVRPGACEHW